MFNFNTASECSIFLDNQTNQWVIIEDCVDQDCNCPVEQLNMPGIAISTALPNSNNSAAMIVTCVPNAGGTSLAFLPTTLPRPQAPVWFNCFGSIVWEEDWLNKKQWSNYAIMGRKIQRTRDFEIVDGRYDKMLAKSFRQEGGNLDKLPDVGFDPIEADCTHMFYFGGRFSINNCGNRVIEDCSVVGVGKYVEFLAPEYSGADTKEYGKDFWEKPPILFGLEKTERDWIPINGEKAYRRFQ